MTPLDRPAGHFETEREAGTAERTLNAVKAEASAVKDAAIDHPHTATTLLALVGLAGFLLGHVAGYRAAEQEYESRRRRFW
ncbi:hypothetical protein ACLE20_00780 [Rhizobium sp. YIM 134829]|uniref:hypothetical protein n=1 Tax=Rhizobium sp. YIM 134829 TaxID=3390453 RepID=UPI00397A4B71